jgi:hypothetical protein
MKTVEFMMMVASHPSKYDTQTGKSHREPALRLASLSTDIISVTLTMIPPVGLIAHHRTNGFNIAVKNKRVARIDDQASRRPAAFFVLEDEGKVDDPDIERKRPRQDFSLGMVRNAK